jgi:hypothetical protein
MDLPVQWNSGTAKVDEGLNVLRSVTCWEQRMGSTLWEELREMAWLATMIAFLSAAGVGLAVVIAAV